MYQLTAMSTTKHPLRWDMFKFLQAQTSLSTQDIFFILEGQLFEVQDQELYWKIKSQAEQYYQYKLITGRGIQVQP